MVFIFITYCPFENIERIVERFQQNASVEDQSVPSCSYENSEFESVVEDLKMSIS